VSAEEQKTLLFYISDRVVLDHFAPVLSTIAVGDCRVIVVVANRLLFEEITKIWWFQHCKNLVVLKTSTLGDMSTIFERLLRVRWNKWSVQRLLRKHQVGIIIVDWSSGVAGPPKQIWSRFKSILFSKLVDQLKMQAICLDIPSVALPHGHYTKRNLILTEHVRDVMRRNNGKLPFADRDSFTVYVYAAEYHRDVVLQNSSMSGDNTVVWGSARYNEQWVREIYISAPLFKFEEAEQLSIRTVLFFMPKWFHLIDKSKTIDLIVSLSQIENLRVLIRGHARTFDATITTSDLNSVVDLKRIVFVPEDTPSPSLIKACDVLIDVDSSIAFDAVLLGKPYVRPRYLQDASVTTIWDELGGAHQTDSLQATIELVSNAALQPAPRDPTFDQVVFGGAGADVLQRYRDGLLALLTR
jgi:hypothetical protein